MSFISVMAIMESKKPAKVISIRHRIEQLTKAQATMLGDYHRHLPIIS